MIKSKRNGARNSLFKKKKSETNKSSHCFKKTMLTIIKLIIRTPKKYKEQINRPKVY